MNAASFFLTAILAAGGALAPRVFSDSAKPGDRVTLTFNVATCLDGPDDAVSGTKLEIRKTNFGYRKAGQ